MFIITDLILIIKKILRPVPRWNPIKFQFSYQLVEANDGHSQNEEISYRFETTKPSYLWLLHLTLLLSGASGAAYQAIYEDELTIGVCIRLLHISSTIVAAAIMCFQHFFAEQIVNFLNESLRFEERWLSSNPAGKEFWTTIEYKKFSHFALHFFRKCYSFPTVNVAISAVLFPFSLWREVPRDALMLILKLNIWGANGLYLFEGLMRAAGALFTYCVMYLVLNNFLILLATSFILANCSLILMVIAVKQVFDKQPPSPKSICKNTEMFREVQLLCCFYNDIHKKRIMPTYVLHWVLCSSVTLFTVVSKFVRDPLAMLIFGNGLAMSIGTIMLVYHLPVKLFIESSNLMDSKPYSQWKKRSVALEDQKIVQLTRRYWRSFPILKVFMFETNFFDSSTPLVILDFSINQAINLILCEI